MFGPSVACLFWNPSINCIQVCGIFISNMRLDPWDFSSVIPVFLNALSSFCDFCVCTQHCSLMPFKGGIKGRLPMLIGTVALRAQGTATSDDMQVDKTQAK